MQYYVCLQHTLWYTMIHNIAILYASTKWSPLNRQRDPVTPPPIPAPSPIHQSLKTINGQQHSLTTATTTTTQQQQHISQNNHGKQQRLQTPETPQTMHSVVKPKMTELHPRELMKFWSLLWKVRKKHQESGSLLPFPRFLQGNNILPAKKSKS